MDILNGLKAKFDIKNHVEVCSGRNDMTRVKLSVTGLSYCEIYLFGCHLTSWKDLKGEERIFTSSEAVFDGKKSIRGGIPIIFPQFADDGDLGLPKHGIARTSYFSLTRSHYDESNGNVSVGFELSDSPSIIGVWPKIWKLEILFTLFGDGSGISINFNVKNNGEEDLKFTAALHTYFLLKDGIGNAKVSGLSGCQYFDKVKGEEGKESSSEISFDSEFDRKYFNTPELLTIQDGKAGQFSISKTGFKDAIVWNPASELASKMSDLGNDEWKKFVCVEAGIVEKPVVLSKGSVWKGSQFISYK